MSTVKLRVSANVARDDPDRLSEQRSLYLDRRARRAHAFDLTDKKGQVKCKKTSELRRLVLKARSPSGFQSHICKHRHPYGLVGHRLHGGNGERNNHAPPCQLAQAGQILELKLPRPEGGNGD